ncbi:transposase IS4 family protein [Haloferax mucosum ATCC BAA-1512]|uniref:Transposase IS4 family protein n=1 Tax=Haloferax mucosum ATCC BAA-1512 TaxID=662479 RepID=M0IMQ4_9EURY|nr:transposase [Haloferax mucosum]ELZ98076.1 transposase IS4 family protein [Haloferax mucosum ATCC BAA-1512]
MRGAGESSSGPPSRRATALIKQAERLCHVHDHITRVIANLEIPEDTFTDQYTKAYPDELDFEAVVRTLLYQNACGFSQREVYSRLRRWAYLQIRFGLNRAPTQQALSYTYRNRLSIQDRQTLTTVAEGIREVAAEHDLLSAPDEGPPIQPEERGEKGLTDDEILRAVRIARDRVFTEFATGRAANAKYEDEVYWELQSYLSMTAHGKRETKRRASRLSQRPEMPHGDTHTRAIKKMGAPDPQTKLPEFTDPTGLRKWKRIRKTLLDPFDRAIENLIKETDFEDNLREPVNVAIDVTPWRFYPSPWKNRDLGIVKEDFPKMVSGYSGPSEDDPASDYERGYKFATLTVIGEDTPIVLAMEPVKEKSNWEGDGAVSMSKAEVVDRLLSKAQEYVDIHKVMADREFDGHAVRDVIDRKGMTYLIPKRVSAAQDIEDIENIKEHPTADIAVKHDVPLTVDGRTHEVDFIYFPPNEESETYAILLTNTDVPVERAAGLKAQYKDRWMIENEYKSIKEHFLPTTSSSDYRVRLFYFVAAVLVYNVWRLTNLLLRTWFDVDLGEKPPVPAGEITEVLALCLGSGIG